MTDTLTPEQRHRCMSHIKGSGTKPELKVRRWLWSHGYRYRLNVKSVPGKPDIVMRPYRTAIFVNGCFWHGHDCGKSRMPKSNTDFWEAKIARNRKRDKENYRVLQENGWHVIVIWECQLKPAVIEHTMREVALLLEENMLTLYKKANPSPYFFKEDKESFPMAAEESPCLGE
jgi:DNA mismatch endonuclease (patch repair protein)